MTKEKHVKKSAIVLAGGVSSRFGIDKGILKLVATAGVNEQEAIENMKEQINKKYKEIIKKLENEFEYEEHNLSNMPTIGNA